MSTRDDGGPAFPVKIPGLWAVDQSGETEQIEPDAHTPGMSLRDYFAAQALAGLIAGTSEEDAAAAAKALKRDNAFGVFAWSAYRYADAMLAARNAHESAQEPRHGEISEEGSG